MESWRGAGSWDAKTGGVFPGNHHFSPYTGGNLVPKSAVEH